MAISMKNRAMTTGFRKDEAETEAILKARSLLLSQEIGAETRSSDFSEGLIFRLANENFIIEIEYTNEVITAGEVTYLPCTPPYINGLINIRGKIIAIVDLKIFFNLPKSFDNAKSNVIVVEYDDIELGILVDDIVGRADIETIAIQKNIHTITDIDTNYIKGVLPDRLVILDIKQIIKDKGLLINEQV
jgi:purine-binding chemotaxis protein CheW